MGRVRNPLRTDLDASHPKIYSRTILNCMMAGTLFPYGLRIPTPAYASLLHGAPNDAQRAHAAQLYDLSTRIRLGLPYPPTPGLPSPAMRPYDPLHYLYGQQDPRARFFHEEPKPSYSYIGLIAMAILSSKEKKLILSDIYQWVIDNYPYFRTRGTGWRNSIRHNLSLNDCFIKAGRAANGKGHYWAVHAAVVEDFERGDFRRRRAQRKVRKAMGLAVPDEEDSPSPPPPSAETIEWRKRVMAMNNSNSADDSRNTSSTSPPCGPSGPPAPIMITPRLTSTPHAVPPPPGRKRGFDVASLLAPDDDDDGNDGEESKRSRLQTSGEATASESDVDVDDTSSNPRAPESPQSPVSMSPWSRPSAFHPLSPPCSWRPFLPAAFPLLRAGHPSLALPLHLPPPQRTSSPSSPEQGVAAQDEEESGEVTQREEEEEEEGEIIPV